MNESEPYDWRAPLSGKRAVKMESIEQGERAIDIEYTVRRERAVSHERAVTNEPADDHESAVAHERHTKRGGLATVGYRIGASRVTVPYDIAQEVRRQAKQLGVRLPPPVAALD